MAKLKKYHETTSNLVDTIGFVATEHGHLARNVNTFYWTLGFSQSGLLFC